MATLSALAGEAWVETNASITAVAAAKESLKILLGTSASAIAAKVVVHIKRILKNAYENLWTGIAAWTNGHGRLAQLIVARTISVSILRTLSGNIPAWREYLGCLCGSAATGRRFTRRVSDTCEMSTG
jgi:hypothetical protein